jgi:hypothetical protein
VAAETSRLGNIYILALCVPRAESSIAIGHFSCVHLLPSLPSSFYSPSVAMASTNRPADPLAKGTLATAKQGLKDLFVWDQRVVVRNDYGEEHCEWQKPEPLKNPFTLFAQLGWKDWLYFVVGFLAWTADAFDFHALSIQTTKLAAYYKQSNTSITTAITLTLLLRSVGAALFGVAGDKFG